MCCFTVRQAARQHWCIISNELGVNFRITSGPAIERPGDLAALLTNLGEKRFAVY